MNFDKNPRQAQRLANEQKKLRQIAKRNPDKLRGKDLAKLNDELILDNVDDALFVNQEETQDVDNRPRW